MKKFADELDAILVKKLKYGINLDVVIRDVGESGKSGKLYYISSLANDSLIVPMMENLYVAKKPMSLAKTIYNGNVQESDDLEMIATQIMQGVVVLVEKKNTKALLIDIRNYPSRSVGEPLSEKSIRGSRDGFNETLMSNIGLVRRRIKSEHLVVKHFVVSTYSKMSVALVYLEDQAPENVVTTIEERLNNLSVNTLIMTDRALEELLFSQKYTPFPLVRYTERPDITAIHLMNGKVAIFVDTSASVIITPSTLIDHTKHVEEFRQSPIVGSFTRLIRFLAVFISVLLVPIWMAVIKNDGYDNALKLSTDYSNGWTLMFQVLVAEFLFEVLRNASIHSPNHLTNAVSLVAALILGQVSLDLGLFLPEILLFCALSSICEFATPSYELAMANKFIKIILIIVVAIFGKIGLLLALLGLFIYLTSMNIWGIPYLYPLIPFDAKMAQQAIIRKSASKKKNL